jgi:hypothetical protein
LPTYIGPLARAYYFWTAKLSAEERARRQALFGTFRDGLMPVRPYRWRLADGRSLLEIPVTTLPVLKLPFHLTYVHYLSRLSPRAALGYLRAALGPCRLAGVAPSFILHPLDLLGGDRVPRLAFFPAMDQASARKMDLFRQVVRIYRERFRLVTMAVHARELAQGNELAVRSTGALPVDRALTEIAEV